MLIIVRHGQSTANLDKRYSGWEDVELTPTGVNEMRQVGKILSQQGFHIDVAFSSVLRRAVHSLEVILEELNPNIEVHKSWLLNECHFGAITGLNREEIAAKYGEAFIDSLRTDPGARPPPFEDGDPKDPINSSLYQGMDVESLPRSESLNDQWMRSKSYWSNEILPRILEGRVVLWVIHGNVLRSLQRELTGSEGPLGAVTANGVPLLMQFSSDGKLTQSSIIGGENMELKKVFLSDGIL